jgi:shikimate kinase
VSPARGPRPRLILIGYRGCGKTTVGERLAERLGWEFVDTDRLVEQAAQQTIRQIFEQQGEAAFRTLESDALAQAVSRPRCVISVGGGALLSDDNRRRLRDAGTCVWLTASPDELARRTSDDPQSAATRPALTDADARAEVRALLAQREPLYRELAEHTIDTEGRTPEAVTELVAKLFSGPARTAEQVR